MKNIIKKFIALIKIRNLKKGVRIIKNEGFSYFVVKFKNKLVFNDYDYQYWLKQNTPSTNELLLQKQIKFPYNPKISIICPVYNTPINILKEMIASIFEQTYFNWELCIANASPDNKEINDLLIDYKNDDERVKVITLQKNLGISENSNAALKLSTGEYIALIDHDDVLVPNALYEIVLSLQECHHDFIYSDEDFINEESNQYLAPSFKPDWSPDLFCTHNYITHFVCIKKTLLDKVGIFNSGFDGAQDYDLFFRCTEAANSIYHIPKILYHWRICKGSVASSSKYKNYAYDAGKKAIDAHLKRCNINGKVDMLSMKGFYHVKYYSSENPLVSIIIPNKDQVKYLKRCIKSLLNSSYKNFEIIICENNSQKNSTFKYYQYLLDNYPNIKIIKYKNKTFNYSLINNYAVKHSRGDYLLFLNNDTEMINENSISSMLRLCQLDHIGIVGGKLLYKNKTIQHAGVVLGFGGAAGHVFHGFKTNEPGYAMRSLLTCNYSAVTGACFMIEKTDFDKVQGFDDKFSVAYNDIDLCLKVRDLNKYIVYEPDSLWFHYESKSRGYENSEEKKNRYDREVRLLQQKWNQYLSEGDPFYNNNFPIDYFPYSLRSEKKSIVIDVSQYKGSSLNVVEDDNRCLYIDKINYQYNNNSLCFYGWCSLPDINLAYESADTILVKRDDIKNISQSSVSVGFIKKIKLNKFLLPYYDIELFNSYKFRISLDAIKKIIDKSNHYNNYVDSFYGTNLLDTSVKEYWRNCYHENKIITLTFKEKFSHPKVTCVNINDVDLWKSKNKNIATDWVLLVDNRVAVDKTFDLEAAINSSFDACIFSYGVYYEGKFIAKVSRDKFTYEFEDENYSLYGVLIKTQYINSCTSINNVHFIINNLIINNRVNFVDNTGYIIKLKRGLKPKNKLVAFYLPQFHETFENNNWWGKGFTDWVNVKRAQPMFSGHNQPRVPSELGYYDLNNFNSQIKQFNLAKKYNIYGFCYYYYWFNGKKLLNKPLEDYLSNPSTIFPFCICWANETWSRRWDGQEHDILIKQIHNKETDLEFIKEIIPILKDKRYIKINNNPILLVYRVNLFKDPKATFNLWRKICKMNGIEKLNIGIIQMFTNIDHKEYGADFSVEFPPHKIVADEVLCRPNSLINDFKGSIYDYTDIVNHQELVNKPSYDLKTGIMLEWDNTARKKNNSTIYSNFSLESYKKWAIKNQIYNCIFNSKDRICFINAWNEWAEGSYLEPDKKYGTQLLEITNEVLKLY